MVHPLEFALDWIVLILSIIVFFVFYVHLSKFPSGEGKRIFTLLTIFLGVNLLAIAVFDGFEITNFLMVTKADISGELEESVEAIAHILQVIGLAVLFYVAVIFAKFADKLEKIRKEG